MTKQLRLSRRTVLKGMGTMIALPWLEAMMPGSLLRAPATSPLSPEGRGVGGEGLPRRMAFLDMANGTPAAEGALTPLPATLQPLAPFQQELPVLSGLTLDKARLNGDGPG